MTRRHPVLRRRAWGLRTRADADAGFTLVGVLAASVILSVTVLCLVRAWAVFDGLTFDLLLRQKAALVLNGEMERLWAVYTGTAYGANDHSRTDYPTVTGLLSTSNTRVSYEANTITTGFTTTSASTFTAQATPDATVFLGAGSPPLNWIWLDRPRNLVARLSWIVCQIKSPDLQSCWTTATSGKAPKPPGGTTPFACYPYGGGGGSSPCELITAVLEYPYAFNAGSPQAVGTTRTLTLGTIVGRR